MFWERYSALCAEIKKSHSAAGVEIGVSAKTVSLWRKGATPTKAVADKVAIYFGVSAAYLYGDTNDRTPARIEFIPADPAKVREHEAKMLQQRQENFERLAQAIKNTPAGAGALNERTEKQLQLFSLMGGLNEAELAEVHGFVDYVMSKRTP